MTLGELERWLTEYIVGVYHAKRHRGIGTSPLQRWTAGVFGDERGSGAGVTDRPTDEERIRLDFLPFVERTVQAYGIAIDGIRYYSDVLRRFVGAIEDGRRRSFIFRRDPRDISTVYFWDPELQRYSPIPYRNTTYPPISMWELRELRRKLQESGRSRVDEAAIFAAYERLREREARAVSETKRTRRARERRPPPARIGDAIASGSRPNRQFKATESRTSRRSRLRSHDARRANRQDPWRSLDPLPARRSDRGQARGTSAPAEDGGHERIRII
jgi:putative transposase